MKNYRKINLLFILTIGLLFTCSTDETQTVTTLNNEVLSLDFDGPLDTSIWNFDIGDGSAQGIPGWGNNELQYYTDRSENVRVVDGMLEITALRENFEGAQYTSARIQTKGKFQQQYGRIEARMKLPWSQGLWPAFWMLGDDNGGTEVWPQIGEIDIMENRGQEPTIMSGAVHGPGYSGGNAILKSFELENSRFDTEFHIFGIEWGENYINFYVDNTLYNQITPDDVTGEWVFNDEFYLILNVAVGGSFVGSPNENTVLPQTMYVDYIKVFE